MNKSRHFTYSRDTAQKLLRNLAFSLLLSPLILSSKASAQPTPEDSSKLALDSQRFHYQKAKSALANNQKKGFQKHYNQLADYPLKQYLEYGQLRKNFRTLPFDEIDAFLEKYPDSFLETRLRANLLHFLASRKKWTKYLNYYDPKLKSVKLQCHALYSQLHTSSDPQVKKTALSEATLLWNVGKSQPDACDPLFTIWKKAGHKTEDIVWSRFDKLMRAGKTSFAQYVSNSLTSKKSAAAMYLKVHRNPKLITQRHHFKGTDLATQQIISHGIKRFSRKNPLDALYHWEMYEAQQLFSDTLILDTKLYVVKRLIRTGHSEEAHRLLSYSRILRKNNLVEEIIREALAEQDWTRVVSSIAMLDDETRTSERWLYWAARAQDELKTSIKGYPSSQSIYQSLRTNRSFYGFISSDKLNKQYSLLDHSLPIDTAEIQRVASMGGMKRAYELWLIGNTTEAHAEWLHLSNRLSTQELLAVGQLARQWGWHNTGIQAMISGNLWNQLTVRFPLAYRDEIYKIANDSTVEPTLIYAIARQESAFDQRAKSPVGAMGLMQLMPKTAQFTAKKSGIQHSHKRELLDATHNMTLGSQYLNHLLKKFRGNRILVAAAYNAGPHRVSKWLSKEGKERPVDIWIETIPYKETRHYVQNILCFSVIYSYRLGQPATFISKEEAKRYL